MILAGSQSVSGTDGGVTVTDGPVIGEITPRRRVGPPRCPSVNNMHHSGQDG
eukprot:m.436507 g.436507  ORF g.436507 m.436507 type:complete len:52 (+) comp105864_c0_seq1:18-173(+)